MTTNFTLYKSLIYETVKNETHISAHVQRATDKNASELAYHEEAGDEQFHVRKLERALYASVDKIKAEIIGYLDTNSATANITTTYNDDAILFTVILSDRFNAAYLTPLADLVSKFIEDNMLFLWWTPINANTAKNYAEHTELDRQQVLKCFIKNAPAQSEKSYANITGSANGGSTGTKYPTAVKFDFDTTTAEVLAVGDARVFSYRLTPANAVDDIIASSNNDVLSASKIANGKIRVEVKNTTPLALITISSLHNLSATDSMKVIAAPAQLVPSITEKVENGETITEEDLHQSIAPDAGESTEE